MAVLTPSWSLARAPSTSPANSFIFSASFLSDFVRGPLMALWNVCPACPWSAPAPSHLACAAAGFCSDRLWDRARRLGSLGLDALSEQPSGGSHTYRHDDLCRFHCDLDADGCVCMPCACCAGGEHRSFTHVAHRVIARGCPMPLPLASVREYSFDGSNPLGTLSRARILDRDLHGALRRRLPRAKADAYSCFNTSTGFTRVAARAGMNVATAMTKTIVRAAAV